MLGTELCECVDGRWAITKTSSCTILFCCYGKGLLASYMVTWLGLIMLMVQLFHTCLSRKLHTSWMKIVGDVAVIIAVTVYLITLILMLVLNKDEVTPAFHLRAWSVFVAGLDLTLMVAKFVNVGIYIHMSMQVAKTLAVLLLIYLPILITFTFTFCLLLSQNATFIFPINGFLKILSMMIGELDLQDNFSWDALKDEKTLISAQVLFVFFWLFAAIVIINLWIGLIVNQFEELCLKADVIRLQKEVEQVSITQNIIMTHNMPTVFLLRKLLQNISNYLQFFDYIQQQILTKSKDTGNISKTKLCFRPSQPKFTCGIDLKDSRLQVNTKYFELHLYNETTGSAHSRTCFTLPGQIVHRTMQLLHMKDTGDNVHTNVGKNGKKEARCFKEK